MAQSRRDWLTSYVRLSVFLGRSQISMTSRHSCRLQSESAPVYQKVVLCGLEDEAPKERVHFHIMKGNPRVLRYSVVFLQSIQCMLGVKFQTAESASAIPSMWKRPNIKIVVTFWKLNEFYGDYPLLWGSHIVLKGGHHFATQKQRRTNAAVLNLCRIDW